ncbi:SiaB family protein kinase [Spirochaeta isovalerica]|uniref:Histidine kinase n=1 Tax=Spirochaeta isovalerica TaxID=150 RepID=A0A841RGT5_9SPIO|nr:SiaB family protein kinase [Spirochaeta isovalerica]MBB6482417.1 hypothetical protein [Spirochaeta isovalerica]
MKPEELVKFYRDLNEEGIYLSYQGPLWQELLEELNGLIKSKVKNHMKPGLYSKYMTLFVEMVQNIIRYSTSRSALTPEGEISYGIVVVGSQDGQNYILTGNTIDSYHKEVLKKSLERLQGQDRDSLAAMFKKQLRGEVHERGRGAGLGLIDIFRRSDKVEYSFVPMGDDRDFFALKVQFYDQA